MPDVDIALFERYLLLDETMSLHSQRLRSGRQFEGSTGCALITITWTTIFEHGRFPRLEGRLHLQAVS